MDDANGIVGNPSLADQRPLVTFVVFAYNQDKIVHEAIEGAFAQTYEPLEIVLSDDCSTDRTFEVMIEMAAAYNGPHTVRVVQNPKNFGVLEHAIVRGKEACGDIFVGAAGDDVSEPERTTEIVDAFGSNSGVGCVYSAVSIIDANGIVLDKHKRFELLTDGIIPRAPRATNFHVPGCSAAYRKWVLDPPISDGFKGYAEDLVFALYLALEGAQIVNVDLPLVKYRAHADALTHVINVDLAESEGISRRVAEYRIEWFDECEKMASALGKSDRLDKYELDRARAFAHDLVDWPDLTFTQRLRRATRADYRGDWKPNLKMAVWRAVRLWGRYPSYQPKRILSYFQRKFR